MKTIFFVYSLQVYTPKQKSCSYSWHPCKTIWQNIKALFIAISQLFFYTKKYHFDKNMNSKVLLKVS